DAEARGGEDRLASLAAGDADRGGGELAVPVEAHVARVAAVAADARGRAAAMGARHAVIVCLPAGGGHFQARSARMVAAGCWRRRDGGKPKAVRKAVERWLWLEKPTSRATRVRSDAPSRIWWAAARTRSSVLQACRLRPAWRRKMRQRWNGETPTRAATAA